jgi:O-antigen/teichoic acid export membrane protein
MGILGWISAFADRFIIAFSIGVVTSGSYSVASGLVSRPYNVLTATFTTHFRPDFYNSINNNDLNKFTTTKIKWILNVLVTSIIGIVFFYFLSGIICDILLAEGYREKIQDYLWLLSITLTLSIFIHVYDNIFLATGNSNKLLKTQLFLAPIPLIFIFIGGYFYNIEGAIYGRIFSDFIKLFVTYNNSKGLI